MEAAPGRRWKQVAVLAAVVGLYWLAMFAATHLPFQTTPTGDPYSLDKFEHVGAFAALSALLCGVGTAIGIRPWILYTGVVVLIAAYGAFDELSQAMIRDRTPDLFDWLADFAGACLGVAAFVIARRVYLNRKTRSSSISEPVA